MPNDVAPIGHASLSDTQTAYVVSGMPIGLQVFLNPAMFERCKEIARFIARAEGFTPRHLVNKPEACFAVVDRALTWNLDPYGVASTTYQTPGGQISYYGSLCQAIIESSGRLEGGVKFELYGDWSKLRGKFEIKTSDRGTKYPVATWKPEDEAGLGIKVSAKLKGEVEPRTMEFDLRQAFPRNSTLWATDPATQIRYTAVRRFATSVVPSLFLGVPFDNEGLDEWAASLKDVTPRPAMDQYAETGEVRPRWQPPEPPKTAAATTKTRGRPKKADPNPFAFADMDGVVHEFADPDAAIQAFDQLLTQCRTLGHAEAVWENAAQFVTALRESGLAAEADMLGQSYADIVDQLDHAESEREATAGGPEPQPQVDPPPPIPPQPEEEEEKDPPASDDPPPEAASAPDPLYVPIETTVQAWFGPARARVKGLMDEGQPAEVFRRFRQVNAAALKRLESEFRSWHSILDKILVSAEAGGR